MCTAAQFGRETAHLQYAHFVAVFFAEEHHGAGFLGIFHAHNGGVDGNVGQNGFVDAAFYFDDFFGSYCLRMGNVETGGFGGNQRAFLFNVFAQYIAQGFVHQVGGAVVAHIGIADFVIHFGGNAVADFQTA